MLGGRSIVGLSLGDIIGATALAATDTNEPPSWRAIASDARLASNCARFGLLIHGETAFDSPFLDDLSFFGKAAYDVEVSDGTRDDGVEAGLPAFTVAAGPYANTWDCSPSPFTDCPEGDVKNGVISALRGVASTLNKSIAECASAPTQASCETLDDCDGTFQAIALGNAARKEALDRGMSEQRATEFRDAILERSNWSCAPVTQTCADLFGVDPDPDNVCQLKLRATDVVGMPGAFSLVLYPGDPGQNPVTAAQGLYLGLTELGQVDTLAQLCSPLSKTRARAFVKRVDNSTH